LIDNPFAVKAAKKVVVSSSEEESEEELKLAKKITKSPFQKPFGPKKKIQESEDSSRE
jgi:hypothetical protein